MSPGEPRARRLVEARLGRAPQDALEAAVVLEAWAGVGAQRALETGRAMMPRTPAAAFVSAAAPVAPRRPPAIALESASFLVTVVAIALWAEPLSTALGVTVVERALVIALPLTVGLQWALYARHLGRPSGLAGLAARGPALIAAAIAIVGALTLTLGRPGLLAGLLTVTWTGGTILIRRGWALAYCAAVVSAVPLLLAGAPVLAAVGAVAAVTGLGAAWALATTEVRTVTPARWTRTLGAGLTGAGVGLLLVGDPTVSWAGGAAAALALLPSAAGAVWAARRLWSLACAFPHALAGRPACAAQEHPAPCGGRPVPARGWDDGAGERLGDEAGSRRGDEDAAVRHRGLRSPLATAAAAIARFVALTAAGSAALLVLVPASGQAGVLAGFGVVALATLLVGLLESLGRPSLATLGVAAGLAGEVLVRLSGAPFPGAALFAGGVVALLVLVPGVLVLLARPARTLATALWIP